MSTEPKPAEDAHTLNAPTLDCKMALVNRKAESKVSVTMLMPSLSVQYPIRTPLPHSRPSVPRPRVAQSRLALPDPLPTL